MATKCCVVCGGEFKTKRSHAETCSPACRKKKSREETSSLHIQPDGQHRLWPNYRSWPQRRGLDWTVDSTRLHRLTEDEVRETARSLIGLGAWQRRKPLTFALAGGWRRL